MKRIVIQAIVCIIIGAVIAFAGTLDNYNPDPEDYSEYSPLFNFIGATLFMAVLFFAVSLIFTKRE